jgi:predicted metal-dependent hydrolase
LTIQRTERLPQDQASVKGFCVDWFVERQEAGKMAVLPGLPGVDVALRRSAQARRFSLRVSRQTGAVTLTLPLRARESEALTFLRAQEDWLREALVQVAPETPLIFGALIPVEGQPLILSPGSGRAIRAEGGLLWVPGDPARLSARLQAWLKVLARDRLVQAVDRHAAVLGKNVRDITLRDTRSRWGSCTSEGRLMFSWRLIMAPPAVLDYVAAHEVAHLIEMNHSNRFWAVVDQLYPDWQVQRAWLRSEGSALQGLRF